LGNRKRRTSSELFLSNDSATNRKIMIDKVKRKTRIDPPITIQILYGLSCFLILLGFISFLPALGVTIAQYQSSMVWLGFAQFVIGLIVCAFAWMDLGRTADAFKILKDLHTEIQKKTAGDRTDAERRLLRFYA
jgi:hypothetical protein